MRLPCWSFNRDAEGAAADKLPIESNLIGRPRRRARVLAIQVGSMHLSGLSDEVAMLVV